MHAWQLKSDANIVSIHVCVSNESNDQIIRQRVHQTLKKNGFTQITVQVEKDGSQLSYQRKHVSSNSVQNKKNGHAYHLNMSGI